MAATSDAPSSAYAGDTVRFTVSGLALDAYPAAEGWAFVARLVGRGAIEGTAVANPGDGLRSLLVTFAAARTAELDPGSHAWTVSAERVVDGVGERQTLAGSALRIALNPARAVKEGGGARHPDEVALESAYVRRNELLEHNVQQYTVASGNRQVIERRIAEVQELIRQLEQRIAMRSRAEAGQPLFGRVEAVFARPR